MIDCYFVLLQGKLGMLLLSLCYQPADNTITINIIKARDLKAKDINGLSGTCVAQLLNPFTCLQLL